MMGSVSKIFEGLRDALEGNVDRVIIEGQTWVRADIGSPEHELMVHRQTIADLESENERLRGWIAESKAAIRPFAAIEPFEPGYSYWVVLGTPKRCSFTHHDLMAIRELAGFLESP